MSCTFLDRWNSVMNEHLSDYQKFLVEEELKLTKEEKLNRIKVEFQEPFITSDTYKDKKK